MLLGARSGDKGGDANVGVWADEDDVAKWLLADFTTDAFRTLLPELAEFDVDRYPLANLRAVNFVVHGVLGWGVASNLRSTRRPRDWASSCGPASSTFPPRSSPPASRHIAWPSGAA